MFSQLNLKPKSLHWQGVNFLSNFRIKVGLCAESPRPRLSTVLHTFSSQLKLHPSGGDVDHLRGPSLTEPASAPRSGQLTHPILQVLCPDVAVEAGRRREPLPTLWAAQRQRVAARGRRGRRHVRGGGCVLGDMSLTVSFEERHPAEPATALLTLRPHPPPLLLHKHRKRQQLFTQKQRSEYRKLLSPFNILLNELNAWTQIQSHFLCIRIIKWVDFQSTRWC